MENWKYEVEINLNNDKGAFIVPIYDQKDRWYRISQNNKIS